MTMQEQLNLANKKIIELKCKLMDAECGVLKDKTVRSHAESIKLKSALITHLWLGLGALSFYSAVVTAIALYMALAFR